MEDRRLFNTTEKATLYMMADGKCEQCGKLLNQSFHADHKIPYSKGGKTDVINAQALCPECNLKKGGRGLFELKEWNPVVKLRDWQKDAYETYQSLNKQDFLLVATPGSGKTCVAIRIAHYLLQMGRVERIVVVTPTVNLCDQWHTNSALFAGIQLDTEWEGIEHEAMHGEVITYGKLGFCRQFQRALTKKKTLVIFDEVHHAGEVRSWGEALTYAFENATYRLCLSGTPFRGDNTKITFVNYGSDGCCKTDFNYDYGKALHDDPQVCRDIVFRFFNGQIEYAQDGQNVKTTFDDKVNEAGESIRLRMALDTNGNWIKDVIKKANEQLMNIREDHQPNAGGLIIAMDQRHAEKISGIIEEITGIKPVLVVSDDKDAHKKLEAFKDKNCKEPWIIAVKMVSEGVDIPRLRVGVYATNYVSPLFFRQAVGRVIRMQQGYKDQTAYFFVPEDERLKAFATEIEQEIQHYVDESIEESKKFTRENNNESHISLNLIDTQAEEGVTVYSEDAFSPEEMLRAEILSRKLGVKLIEQRIDIIGIAKIARELAPIQVGVKVAESNDYNPLRKRLKNLSFTYNMLVKKYAFEVLGGKQTDTEVVRQNIMNVHIFFNRMQGKKLQQCDEKEILFRIEKINMWFKTGEREVWW